MKTKAIHFVVLAFVALAGVFMILGPSRSPTPADAQTVPRALKGWAWSENIGWISMNCDKTEGGNTCATSDYKVTLTKNGSNYNLGGYAWSENIGWVSFDGGSVAGCPGGGTCAPYLDTSTAPNWTLKGWARACSVFASGCSGALSANAGGWDGFIKLSGQTSEATPQEYGISFDPETNIALNCTSCKAWGSDVVSWVDFAPKMADGTLFNSPVSISPIISPRSVTITSSYDIWPINVEVPLTLTVIKNGVTDTSINGKTVTVAATNGATVVGSADVPINSGVGTFKITNTSAEQPSVLSMPASSFSADLSETKTITFASLAFDGKNPHVESNYGEKDVAWTLKPIGAFRAANRCTRTGAWTGTTNNTSEKYTPASPDSQLGLTCYLNDNDNRPISTLLNFRVADVPVVTLTATPATFAYEQGVSPETVVSWTTESDVDMTSCSKVDPSPAGWTPTISSIPGTGSRAFTLPSADSVTTFAAECTNANGTGRGETVVRVGSATPTDATLMLNVVEGSVSGEIIGGKWRNHATLAWQTTGMDSSWSCTGTTPSGDTNWKNQSLSPDGGTQAVLTPSKGDAEYTIECSKGAEKAIAATTVTRSMKPVLTVNSGTTTLTFVTNKTETSTKVTLKLKDNGVMTSNVRYIASDATNRLTPGASLRLAGTSHAAIKGTKNVSNTGLSIGKTEARDAGAQLWFELRPDQLPGASGKPYKDFRFIVRVQSVDNPKYYTDTPITVRVQNFIPSFQEN